MHVNFNYKSGVRTLQLITRNKDQKDPNSGGGNRVISRMISYSEDEFDDLYEKMLIEARKLIIPARIYVSVNERDIDKAIYNFKKRQLDIDRCSERNKLEFYNNCSRVFFSCLSKPCSSKTNYFIIDLDDPRKEVLYETEKRLRDITQVLHHRQTLNGWHIVTTPYNPFLTSDLEIKKDAELLLSYSH